MSRPVAMAIAAHPDDIEFYMAGTLLLLRQHGYKIHYMNLSSGNCGSLTMDAAETARVRAAEAVRAAGILGAVHHPSITHDMEVLYTVDLLKRLAAVVRNVNPDIVLTHSPDDYMEDHMNTSRLAVSATFTRGIPNFQTTPDTPTVSKDATIYHAMPHGLRGALRQRVIPEIYVDTTAVTAVKRDALAAHESQKAWLDATQGMDSYLDTMEAMSTEVGRLSGRFAHAEGWRRHTHYGIAGSLTDPLSATLQELAFVNSDYEKGLG